uniref:Uncharacterized protein n=1 Tax=Tanacetum cinerariifolium TaxID=118510 RepID=A0A699HVJ1_TANCI|nr:hypothetical protein [Tanacetum cinerariifolium]
MLFMLVNVNRFDLRYLSRFLYKMHNVEKFVQRRIVLALAHLCSPEDQEAIFVDNYGLDLLLELLQSAHSKRQGDAYAAFCKLAEKAMKEMLKISRSQKSDGRHVS